MEENIPLWFSLSKTIEENSPGEFNLPFFLGVYGLKQSQTSQSRTLDLKSAYVTLNPVSVLSFIDFLIYLLTLGFTYCYV